MRCVGLPRIAKACDDLPTTHSVADAHSETSRLKVGVEDIATATDVEQYMISADRRQRDRRRLMIRGRIIFRNTVQDLDNRGVSHRQHIGAIGGPVGVYSGIAPKRLAIRA